MARFCLTISCSLIVKKSSPLDWVPADTITDGRIHGGGTSMHVHTSHSGRLLLGHIPTARTASSVMFRSMQRMRAASRGLEISLRSSSELNAESGCGK